MIELLLPLWTPPQELPIWAGLGDLEKVRGFFDESGALASTKTLVYPDEQERQTKTRSSIMLSA